MYEYMYFCTINAYVNYNFKLFVLFTLVAVEYLHKPYPIQFPVIVNSDVVTMDLSFLLSASGIYIHAYIYILTCVCIHVWYKPVTT